MATQNVTVTVIGTQREIVSRKGDLYTVAAEEDRTESKVPGTYSYVNGKHFLMYEEDLGEGQKVGNTVKIYEGGFEVIKKGVSSAHMYFRAGQRDEGWYDTPFGRIAMALDVKTVEITTEAGSLCAKTGYVLEMNGEAVSRNQVCILVEGIQS